MLHATMLYDFGIGNWSIFSSMRRHLKKAHCSLWAIFANPTKVLLGILIIRRYVKSCKQGWPSFLPSTLSQILLPIKTNVDRKGTFLIGESWETCLRLRASGKYFMTKLYQTEIMGGLWFNSWLRRFNNRNNVRTWQNTTSSMICSPCLYTNEKRVLLQNSLRT